MEKQPLALPEPQKNSRYDISRRPPVTEEYWHHLQELKQSLLNGASDEELLADTVVSPYIIRSWLRSRRKGVDPYGDVGAVHVSKAKFARIRVKNRALIEIVMPLIRVFEEQSILKSGHILYLTDANGVCLFQSAEERRFNAPGLVLNEESIGTCVHPLCLETRTPVQLYGPEQYSEAMRNIVVSGAPIRDHDDNIIGTIILSRPMLDEPWQENFKRGHTHIFALIVTLAAAVENQLALDDSRQALEEYVRDLHHMNEMLTETNDTLDTILSCVDEGVVNVDLQGNILTINNAGRRIFQLSKSDSDSHNVREFFEKADHFLAMLAEGQNMDVEENVTIGKKSMAYFINIRPVRSPGRSVPLSIVLRLNPMAKMESFVASRAGSIAKYTFDDIIAVNKDMRNVIALTERFANSKENILLNGESGTGKELFAQAIHNRRQTNGPFIALNCASIPRELIESELFGYEGGSFTGAERAGRPGKIELANGGTLFLDEIGDMPFELQAVLLRTLEDRQVTRIGGRQAKKVDFSLISATNKDLSHMIQDNLFRADLYFRLSVLHVIIPPLRNRRDDIPVLCNYFMESYCQKQKMRVPEMSGDARRIITQYDWPGNVRQVENAMIFAVNAAGDGVIRSEHLPQFILQHDGQTAGPPHTLVISELEQAAIREALRQVNNNVYAAAPLLGMSRSTLYRKLQKYEIEV